MTPLHAPETFFPELPPDPVALIAHAHPDDNETFTGETARTLIAAGVQVHTAVFSGGELSDKCVKLALPLGVLAYVQAYRRIYDEIEANTRLGIPPSQQKSYTYPDGYLANCVDDMADDLDELIGATGASILVIPEPGGIDDHNDHKAVSRAGHKVAARAASRDSSLQALWLAGRTGEYRVPVDRVRKLGGLGIHWTEFGVRPADSMLQPGWIRLGSLAVSPQTATDLANPAYRPFLREERIQALTPAETAKVLGELAVAI